MKPVMRRISLLFVIVLIAVSLLTSFQMANAHSYAIPPGCWETYHAHYCQRCGFLWLWQKDAEELSWKCPAGNTGSYNLYGACSTCRF